MTHVATFVCNPTRLVLDDMFLATAVSLLFRARAGKRAEIVDFAQRAGRGEVVAASALRAGVALFAGVAVRAFNIILAEQISFNPSAETLIKTIRAHGAYTALVSNSFSRFAEPIATLLGCHESLVNRLLIESGRLTGKLVEPIHDGTTKREILKQPRLRRGLQAETLAVRDDALILLTST
jgi:phosphoserine phosphatase